VVEWWEAGHEELGEFAIGIEGEVAKEVHGGQRLSGQ
jgi:hypothetical protein